MRESQVRVLSGGQKNLVELKKKYYLYTLLAQMVVAVVLHTTGHRFDPCRVYNKGELSNWLAQQTVNLSSKDLGGSSPSSPTTNGQVAQLVEQSAVNR